MKRLLSLVAITSLWVSGVSIGSAQDRKNPDLDRDPVGYWAEQLVSKDAKVRATAVAALAELGRRAGPAVSALIDVLENDPNKTTRRSAVTVLGRIGPGAKAAVPALIKVLEQGDYHIQSAAARSLGEIGPDAKAAVPALTRALDSKITSVTYNAAHALGAIGPGAKEAEAALLTHMSSVTPYIRATAAEALWRIDRHPDAIPALIRHLQDPKTTDPGEAAETLGRLGPDAKAAVPALVAALKDRQNLTAVQAAEALWYVAKHETAIPTLVATLKDPNITISSHAAMRLGRIGPHAKVAVPALLAVAGNGPYLGPSAVDALKQIDPDVARKAGFK